MRTTLIALAAALALAACTDPLDGLDRLSDVELAKDAPVVEALPDPAESRPEGGFFTRFFGGGTSSAKAVSAGAVAEAAAGADVEADAETDDGAEAAPAAEPETQGPETQGPETPARGGFLSALFGAARTDALQEPGVEVAALATPENRGGARRGVGLFGGAPAAAQGNDVRLGQTLPYGTVGRLCGVPDRQLGKTIARHPERGRGYTLYDSAPGSTAPHDFYITGFDDNCARQVTGALVMFGTPTMHEQLRYGAAAQTQPYSRTDEAYETLKRQVCGAAPGTPCGSRISRMEKSTVFVTIYEKFGNNARWADLLLHDGEVVVLDIKGN